MERNYRPKRVLFGGIILVGALLGLRPAQTAELAITKHIIPAPAPYHQPLGAVTPDGTFNVRDPGAPFHSDRLADALGLDAQGKLQSGDYLNLNHAIYTAYRLAGDKSPPGTVLVLMPGTWVGAMSLDQFARDLIRLAADSGQTGLEVWLVDRRSEQLEDHTGLRWAEANPGLPTRERIQGLSDYYRPAFDAQGQGSTLLKHRFVPLDQDAVRFMANWGTDTTIRDWRAVVLEAQRRVGNQVVAVEGGEPKVMKQPGRRVFIGGHSLGGSLTVLYAACDFDRRPDREQLGADDVDGLVLLEGGSLAPKKTESMSAEAYRRSVEKKFKDGKVYFDFNILGIRYAPSTMLALAISGWAANNARGEEATFPDYARPKTVRLPHITNEAVLAFAMDDDFSPFFIARVSMGYPSGQLGRHGQFEMKKVRIPADPNPCGLVTPWKPGHRPKDPNYLYSWINIDQKPKAFEDGKPGHRACTQDDDQGPEVTDFYAFARSTYGGADEYEEAPGLATGPNDLAEWYFPPRLSTDKARLGMKIQERDGTEIVNAVYLDRIALPVISFTGDHSMGHYSVPKVNEKYFTKGALAHPETAVHLIRGYTHMDIPSATRNHQPDLAGKYESYNAPAVYTYRFLFPEKK